MTSSLILQLEQLSTIPQARLLIQGQHGWIVLQSYAKPHQALCEFASNTYLDTDHQLTKEQIQHLQDKSYSWRRNNRSLGKIVPIALSTQRIELAKELTELFSALYQQAISQAKITIQSNVLSSLHNSKLLFAMRQLSQKRTHDLRIEVYKQFLNTSLLLIVDEQGLPKSIDTLSKMSCYGVFTDDKSIRIWDPRGCHWKKMYSHKIISLIMPLNPASLIINPRGDISGEFYRNELNSLHKAVHKHHS